MITKTKSVEVRIWEAGNYADWEDVPITASALIEDTVFAAEGYAKAILKTEQCAGKRVLEARWNWTGYPKGHYVRAEGVYPLWQINIDGELVGPPMAQVTANAWAVSLGKWAVDKSCQFNPETIKVIPAEV